MSENDADAIQAWVVSKLSARLGLEPQDLDIREPFASYGLGSTEAVGLTGELAEWLGRDLSPAVIYEYPTIEALVGHLAGPSPDLPKDAAKPGEEAKGEPVAIIGLGCRFPGANDASAFWRLLRDGVDAIREVPIDRFDAEAFYDSDPAVPGRMNTRWGGFLDQVDRFDAHFFGISPREALRMDPQQRLLLEVSWEALQDAGQVPERLAGTAAGVFIGIATNDYGRLQWNDFERIDAYAGTGNAMSIAANRISYLFDFRGPSLAIDTACSSSLVAVHLACASLRNGESTLALAGGVNLILSPAIAINFTKAGAMAPDGRCKAFDARADGYVRSEGAGVVVLKLLSKALADGDPIYAVIRGSAVNQDGRSNGLMAPNPLAQEAVLREAYRQAAVSPGKVGYVETHGTGTLLGDPIEAIALGKVLSDDRPPGHLCAMGSVKTNIGHLEAAAGIAGLIKVALALRHREIPPSLHFEKPNPHIPFEALPLRVQTALEPWPTEFGPALAGVSSFGFGGTNAHLVLEEAPPAPKIVPEAERQAGTQLLPLSARSPEALRSVALAYRTLFAAPAAAATLLADICHTAGARLGHHDHRLAATGHSPADLTASLEAFLRGEARPGLSSGRKLPARRRKLVFVFPGQGSQWFGMGRLLLERNAIFRAVIERCDQAMRPYGDWSLLAELTATEAASSRLGEVDIIQPTLFAIQIALAALWRSWGITPQAVVGHSLGEAAAAYVAGALSFEDAIRVVCHRSRLFKRTVGRGAMATVELSAADAGLALSGFEDSVSVAVSNGPASTVLSGDPTALAAIVDRLQRRDVFCRMIKVDFASHSPQMEPLRADLLQALDGLRPAAEKLPIYSTVTGRIHDGLGFDAAYWVRNMREPVLFSETVQRLVDDGHDIFLEISPHPILLSAMRQGFQHFDQDAAVLPSLRRGEDEQAVLLGSLGALYCLGYPIDWDLVHPAGSRCVPLPAYPWQRERFWFEPQTGTTPSRREPSSPSRPAEHPLLGRRLETPHHAETQFWESRLDRASSPHLDDHCIQGVAVLPVSAYVRMALAVALEVFAGQSVALEDIAFHKALFLPAGGTHTLQMALSRQADGAAAFRIYARAGSGEASFGKSWTLHASGTIRLRRDDGAAGPARASLMEMRTRYGEAISGPDYYRKLDESGIHYGPFFRSIIQLWRNEADMLAEVRIPEESESDRDGVAPHPAAFDAGLQVLAAALAVETAETGRDGLMLPTRIVRIVVHGRPGRHLWSHARVRTREADVATGDVELLDEAGRVVVEIEGLRFEYLGEDAARRDSADFDDWLYEFQWRPKERAAGPVAAPAGDAVWLILADQGGVGAALAAFLEARGDRGILVARGDSFERTDEAHYTIRPEREDDVGRLFAALGAAGRPAWRGIVHLWSLDAPAAADLTAASLEAAQGPGCGSALLLVQALARLPSSDLPRLWLVTQGVQAIGETLFPLSIAPAPLWGLGRVIAREHPTFWGGLIDLEPGAVPPDAVARQLGEEIRAADGEDQLAFRQGRRYVGRLRRRRPSPARQAVPPFRWRTDGSYLISGGLGDLGLLVARWMVDQGARRLILLGRHGLPPRSEWTSAEPGSRLSRQVAAIRTLESLGASVHPAAVDVADEAALGAFLEAFQAEGWPPIKGVVHAAGVLQDGLLTQLDAAALQAVLRPKVTGAWLLHHLLRDAPLDFFVLFSSAGSVLGQSGQGNYAAANAFLDVLAHHRRARGRPALSIDWGAWTGEGFADSAGGKRLAQRLALLGIGGLAPAQALGILGRLLGQAATQVMAVPVDWKRFRDFYPDGNTAPLLSDLAADDAADLRPADRTSPRRDALIAAEPAERRRLLQSYLSEQVARVLGLGPSTLDPLQPLSDLGLDSLMAVDLKNRIAIDLKVNVPVAKFLQGFSVDQAVTQVLAQLATEAADPAALPVPAVAPTEEQQTAARLLVELDQLSDEEVGALLVDMLDEKTSP